MGESDGIWFVCPRCGAANAYERAVCVLCGHALDVGRRETGAEGPDSPDSFTSAEPDNPYKPPATLASPPFSFRISSLLMVIAVIAVCLAAVHENWVIGIIVTVVVAPALVYTVVVAGRSKSSGRPMDALETVFTFLAAIIGVVAIEFSAIVAFCVTCFPIGLVSVGDGRGAIAGLVVALVAGGIAGVAAGSYATKRLLFWNRRRRRVAGKP